MAKYSIELDDVQEEFLDMYLQTFPLREGFERKDYPGLIAKNFINSLISRREEVKSMYKQKYGKDYAK